MRFGSFWEMDTASMASSVATLQAPAVAVLWQLLLARCLHVELNPFEPFVLALTVWLIYVADHLMDTAHPAVTPGEPLRKEFCRRHWHKFLAGAMMAAFLLAFGVQRLLWPATVRAGLWISIGAAVYLTAVQVTPGKWRRGWPREFVVATIFTLGLSCAIWAGDGERIAPLVMPGALFLVLVLANCSAIETWEWEASGRLADLTPNGMTRWVSGNLARIGLALASGSTLLGLTSALAPLFAAAASLAGLALALMALCRRAISARYVNLLADLALCSPLVVLGAAAIIDRCFYAFRLDS